MYYERKLLDMLRNTYEAQDVRVSGLEDALRAVGCSSSSSSWASSVHPGLPGLFNVHTHAPFPLIKPQVGPGKESFIHTVCGGLQNSDSPAFVAIPGYSTGSSFLFKLFDG